MNLAFFHLIGKNGTTQHIFGENQESGGIAVQTVDTAEDKGDILLLKVPGYCICESVFIIADGRMYRHICRFIDDHQIFVFIDNVERQADGNDIFRGLFFLECDFQQITGFEREIKECFLVVQTDRTGMLLEPGADVPGIAVMTQKIIDALITVLCSYCIREYSFHMWIPF